MTWAFTENVWIQALIWELPLVNYITTYTTNSTVLAEEQRMRKKIHFCFI